MNSILLEKYRAYLNARGGTPVQEAHPLLRSITISRETGAGAITVSQLVVEYLEMHQVNDPLHPWTIFDRDLVKKVIEHHKLSETVEQYMQEDAPKRVDDLLSDVLGVHPPARTLVQHTNRTILRLAMSGNVIIVGRGANLITSSLTNVFHARLIAPLEFRIQNVREYYNLSHQKAVEFVREGDRAKARYYQRNFNSKIQEPLQYHLTINTGLVNFSEAAHLIGTAVLEMPIGSESSQLAGTK
jgi:cytidylate kinase